MPQKVMCCSMSAAKLITASWPAARWTRCWPGPGVEVAPYKKNAMDFVLWKPSDAATPGWDSPWGRGRPGWHIECSAMAGQYLGETFDIHGGGIDLMFPHHENEIAQSEGAHHGHALANVWMHNGFLQVEGEKMSKSLGNFFTIRDLLADWPGEVLRFNMLRTHYRQPIDFTVAGLRESWKMLERWYGVTEPLADPAPGAEFFEALGDDLNTPAAIAALHQAGEMDLAGGLGLPWLFQCADQDRGPQQGGHSRHRRCHRSPQRRPRRQEFCGKRPHP